MNRYDSYKDSGVDWIGEIPNHWDNGKMGYILTNNDGGVWGDDVEDDSENGTLVIRSTEITIDGNWDLSNPMKRFLTEREIEKALLKSGDIVITKSSGSPDHIGKSVIVDEYVESLKCCYSNFVQRIRFNENYIPQLYHYILNSDIVRKQFRYLTQSTTGLGNLNGTTLNLVELPYIPYLEQHQIVSFLDTKTSLIDSLIEKTGRKIELLKEQRTSLINEVVTKGLNPDVEMKDSGVEWIGEIPSHWSISKLKYHLSQKLSYGVLKPDKYFEEDSIPLIRTVDISEQYDISSFDRISPELSNQYKRTIVKEGDVLISVVGSIGKTIIVDEGLQGCNLSRSVCRIVLKDNLNNRFLNYLFKSEFFLKKVFDLTSGSIQSVLNLEDLSSFTYSIPSTIQEQHQIVEYLDSETQLIDKTISNEEKRIELLKEYRQSLISEVVTGKIKVPGV